MENAANMGDRVLVGQEVCGKSLSLPLNWAESTMLILKKKKIHLLKKTTLMVSKVTSATISYPPNESTFSKEGYGVVDSSPFCNSL